MTSKNFIQMVNNVASEVQDTSTAMKTLIKNYLNKRYFQILRKFDWRNIRTDYTLTTVAGTQDYALPSNFKKPVKVTDTTNQRDIPEVLLEDLARYYYSTLSTNGEVARYAMLEDVVQSQPTSAAVVSIVSSIAGDTSQTVTVRGLANNVEISEEVSVNGVTPATTTNSFSNITGISKDANSTGYITITSGATTLAVLAPKQFTSHYKKIRLHQVPNGAITLAMPYIIDPMRLVEDGDYPVLDVCDLMETGAKADAFREKRQFQKGQVFEALFEKEIEEYIWDQENSANRVTQFKPATFNRDDLV